MLKNLNSTIKNTSSELQDLLDNNVLVGHIKSLVHPSMKSIAKQSSKSLMCNFPSSSVLEILQTRSEEIKKFKRPLFVFLKRNTRPAIKDIIFPENADILEEWPNGFLTNFDIIIKNINTFRELKSKETLSTIKEKRKFLKLQKYFYKLSDNFCQLPDVLVLTDLRISNTIIKEAKKTNIPVFGIADIDANLDIVEYPILGNDDSAKSVSYIFNNLLNNTKDLL